MTTYAHKLDAFKLDADALVYLLPTKMPEPLTLSMPAIWAMTDLKKTRAISINPNQTIDFAMQLMKHVGIRLLVVVNENDLLEGLITARDIMGEKPMTIMNRDRIKHEEILVSQVMTPRSVLNPFNFRDIEHATVREVVNKLREARRQHAIVVEADEQGPDYYVRGIFSITQIARQLGMDISADGPVQSFADFEKLIA